MGKTDCYRNRIPLGLVALLLLGCGGTATRQSSPAAPATSKVVRGDQSSALPSVVDALDGELIRARIGWKTTSLSPEQALKVLNRSVAWNEQYFAEASKNPKYHDEAWEAEHAQYLLHTKRVATLFDEYLAFGSKPLHFVASRIKGVPSTFIRIATVEGETALILCGLAVEDVYNTNRTTTRSRATLVAEQAVIPALRQLSEVFADSGLPRLGVMVFYGSRDFSNESSEPQLESVAIISQQGKLKEFLAGSTTVQQFADESHVFIGAAGHVTRSTLKFE